MFSFYRDHLSTPVYRKKSRRSVSQSRPTSIIEPPKRSIVPPIPALIKGQLSGDDSISIGSRKSSGEWIFFFKLTCTKIDCFAKSNRKSNALSNRLWFCWQLPSLVWYYSCQLTSIYFFHFILIILSFLITHSLSHGWLL